MSIGLIELLAREEIIAVAQADLAGVPFDLTKLQANADIDALDVPLAVKFHHILPVDVPPLRYFALRAACQELFPEATVSVAS